MSNNIGGTYVIDGYSNDVFSILPADHVLIVKLSDEDRHELSELFETKIHAIETYNELNEQIRNIVNGRLTPEEIDNLKTLFVSVEDANLIKTDVENIKISMKDILKANNDTNTRIDKKNKKIDDTVNVILDTVNW